MGNGKAHSLDGYSYGLDVVRAWAIWLVLLSHMLLPDNPVQVHLGRLGVELFFALSGFLIGGILCRLCDEGLDYNSLWRFMVRRWMRTIPLYVLTVGIYWWLLDIPHVLHMLTFTQSFFNGVGITHFGQSWSLAVEEWSYLLTAIGLGVTLLLGKRPNVAAVAVVLIVAGLLGRMLLPPETTSPRFVVSNRLDAIAYGLLLAYLWRRYSEVIALHADRLAILGVVIVGLEIVNTSIGWPAFFPAMSVGLALLIPAAMTLQPGRLANVAVWSSRLAYGLYLFHMFGMGLALGMGLSLLGTLAMYLAISFGAAYMGHVLIERPFMAMRPSQRASVTHPALL